MLPVRPVLPRSTSLQEPGRLPAVCSRMDGEPERPFSIHVEVVSKCALYLVNMDHIQSASDNFVMDSGDVVQIRQNGAKEIKEKYKKYIS